MKNNAYELYEDIEFRKHLTVLNDTTNWYISL